MRFNNFFTNRPPTNMKLRIRLPKSPVIHEITLDDDAPWVQLLMIVAEQCGARPDRIKILGGFPPKPFVVEDDVQMLQSIPGLKDGDLLSVQVGEGLIRQGTTDGKYVRPADDRAVFMRRVMPSDNSCLFHACAYVLKDKSRTLGPSLRQQCAEVVVTNPEKFTTAMLGQPPMQYAQWILQPTSWGGAIELSILSFMNQVEIIALDIESGAMRQFGETEGYSVRAFVIYTGKHYDAMSMSNPLASSNERDDQVLFNPRDERVLQRALRFVREECRK